MRLAQELDSKPRSTDPVWAVLARRTHNAGTRFENTDEVPVFYLENGVHRITNRTEARTVAARILGADLPGSGVRFEVHRVV